MSGSSEQHDAMVADLLVPEIAELIESGQNRLAREALMELLEPEIADVLMALPAADMAIAFRLLSRDKAAEVFVELPPEEQEALLNELNNEQLAQLLDRMEPDDRAQLFEELPGQVASKLLGLMKPEERKRTQIVLGYPAESVGRLMTPDYLTIREDWIVRQALDHIRAHGGEVESFTTLFVINEKGKLLDDVRLRDLILADLSEKIEKLMDGQVIALRATDDREEAVRLMERYDRPQLPVVDRDDVLVGMVTFDDVADVAEKEFTEDIQKMGGAVAIDQPYSIVPLWELVRKRGVLLMILFVAGLLTVSTMGFFQDELREEVILALFIPLIIASGGNSGSQAATLIVRSLAVGELKASDWGRTLRRELVSGLALGSMVGVIGMLVATAVALLLPTDSPPGMWDALHTGFAIGTAVVGVVLTGVTVGSMLPFVMMRLGLDPAASSTPFVATIVDVTGLVIYFTVAAVILGL